MYPSRLEFEIYPAIPQYQSVTLSQTICHNNVRIYERVPASNCVRVNLRLEC